MDDFLFLLEETEFHSVNNHGTSDFTWSKYSIYDIYISEQGDMFGAWTASELLWSTVFFYEKVPFLKCLNVLPFPTDGKMNVWTHLYSHRRS